MIDPKPELSRAAIEANCEYYRSQCEQLRLAHQRALEELIKWETKLNEI
jgi:hypothetical protein